VPLPGCRKVGGGGGEALNNKKRGVKGGGSRKERKRPGGVTADLRKKKTQGVKRVREGGQKRDGGRGDG